LVNGRGSGCFVFRLRGSVPPSSGVVPPIQLVQWSIDVLQANRDNINIDRSAAATLASIALGMLQLAKRDPLHRHHSDAAVCAELLQELWSAVLLLNQSDWLTLQDVLSPEQQEVDMRSGMVFYQILVESMNRVENNELDKDLVPHNADMIQALTSRSGLSRQRICDGEIEVFSVKDSDNHRVLNLVKQCVSLAVN
jgi:hypothetical protein